MWACPEEICGNKAYTQLRNLSNHMRKHQKSEGDAGGLQRQHSSVADNVKVSQNCICEDPLPDSIEQGTFVQSRHTSIQSGHSSAQSSESEDTVGQIRNLITDHRRGFLRAFHKVISKKKSVQAEVLSLDACLSRCYFDDLTKLENGLQLVEYDMSECSLTRNERVSEFNRTQWQIRKHSHWSHC